MKAIRYILCIGLILAAGGLLAYQSFVEKNLESSDLFRCILIILGALSTMLKKPKRRTAGNKKALYQKAYPQFIQEPFAEEPKLEKKFYSAVDDYNHNKSAAAIPKLEALRKECRRSTDLYAVTVFTALCLDDLKRYGESVKHYEAARNIRDCSTLASNMGLCWHRMGNFRLAMECYGQAIQLDPKNAAAYNNISTLYFARGEYECALDAAKDALEINAAMPQALSTAALCCKLLGNEEDYATYYRRAVAAGYDGEKIKRVIRKLNEQL